MIVFKGTSWQNGRTIQVNEILWFSQVVNSASIHQKVTRNHDLVGGLEHFLFSHILGISSSQLTSSYFSEGFKPPTSDSKFTINQWFLGLPISRLAGGRPISEGLALGKKGWRILRKSRDEDVRIYCAHDLHDMYIYIYMYIHIHSMTGGSHQLGYPWIMSLTHSWAPSDSFWKKEQPHAVRVGPRRIRGVEAFGTFVWDPKKGETHIKWWFVGIYSDLPWVNIDL